jgi:hypothetical protein
MSDTPILKLDWCSHAAAKYAVEHWHYSRSLRIFPNIAIGAWEDGAFIGALVFARGATGNLGKPYGLTTLACVELIRVALRRHCTPVSRLLAIAVKLVQRKETGLRLLVSFADQNYGHHGGIYQAAGWLYTGETSRSYLYRTPTGKLLHGREVSATGRKRYFGESRRVPKIDTCRKVAQLPKHRYLYPLDAAMRAQILPLAQPYPKRATSILADAAPVQGEESGAAPTVALRG